MPKNEGVAIHFLARGAQRMVRGETFTSQDFTVSIGFLGMANDAIGEPPTQRMVTLLLELYEEMRNYITA